jgi:hypothetical protein
MKNFFLIIALSTFTLLGKAQGNLQFNQVLTYNGTLLPSGLLTSPTYTCPAGKVWKIESKTRAPQTLSGSAPQVSWSGKLSFYLNSNSLQDLYVGSSTSIIETSPLWLKAGDNIYFEFTFTGVPISSCFALYYLSIIEYNIVP